VTSLVLSGLWQQIDELTIAHLDYLSSNSVLLFVRRKSGVCEWLFCYENMVRV